MSIFLETTTVNWCTWTQMVSLFTSSFCLSWPFVLKANFDGAGGNVSNWRALLGEIVLTLPFLSDILKYFPVLPWKRVGQGKDESVNRALWLPQFLSNSPLARLLFLLSYSRSKHQAVALWTAPCQCRQQSGQNTSTSAAYSDEKHTATFHVGGIITGDHLKGSNLIHMEVEWASHCVWIPSLKSSSLL